MDNSAVNQPTHERISQIEMEKRLKEAIVYTPDISKAVPIRMSDDWKEGQYIANANGHVNVCHFSDTFIIYVHYLCRREAYWLATPKYEPYPLLLGEKDTLYCPVFYQEHQIYLSFLQTCMDFFCQSIIAGIPDFVAHGFLTGLTEMNPHNIGRPVNLLHQCRSVLRRRFGRPGSFLSEILSGKNNRRTPSQMRA